MKQVTIKDIAKIAGVSPATISRALNNSPEISRVTRTRINEICAREGYRTNSLARSLVSSRTHVIGLILPDITHSFYAEVALNIEICARNHNDTIMMCNSLHDVQQLGTLLDCLTSYQVDGIIIASSRNSVAAYLNDHPPSIPSILLGDCLGHISDHSYSMVSLNNQRAGRLGTEYLIGLGHRSIVYIGSRADSASHVHRRSGYEQSMRDHGLEPVVLPRNDADSSLETGYTLATKLFSSKRPCSAVFAATDSLALGVMKAADKLGIRIPHDLSLLGVGNTTISSLTHTNLTSVDQCKQQLAEGAVQLLREQIGGTTSDQITHRMIQPLLIKRETCAPLKA